MKFKEFINTFKTEAEETIKDLVSIELTGEAKKEVLDTKILEWALQKLKEVKLNFLLKLAIEQLLKRYISVITQNIYELLKTKIRGL